jgi:DNA-binding response OmpR family regulator
VVSLQFNAMTRKSVVIVDSNLLLSKAIETSLIKRGYDVKTFGKGADAVKYLSEEKPDLVLLNSRLPDCDGWFLAKLLNKLGLAKEIPLIVISDLEPDRENMAEVKPYAYIQKPFDMIELMQVVERSLVRERQPAEG